MPGTDDRPRCGMLVTHLDRSGALVQRACQNVLRAGERRCRVHANLFKWAARERKVRHTYRQRRRPRDRGWSLERLAGLREDRQLDLFAWGDAFAAAEQRCIRGLLDERVNDAPDWPGIDADDWAWGRYQAARDAHERNLAALGQRWAQIGENARLAAERAVLEAGWPSWGTLRWLVYERDGGVCFVCDQPVPFEAFELGHLQDRMMGGSDRPDNVVVMCARCNRARKPLHETAEDAREWAAACRTRFRQMRREPTMTQDEFLLRWMMLGTEQRARIVDEALTWTDQVEDTLAEQRRWRAEHSDEDARSG